MPGPANRSGEYVIHISITKMEVAIISSISQVCVGIGSYRSVSVPWWLDICWSRLRGGESSYSDCCYRVG